MDAAPAGKMLVETLAEALRVHLLRQYSNLEPASVGLANVRGALDKRRLDRVTDFIETHLGEDLSIEALAQQAHFTRWFKRLVGTTPGDLPCGLGRRVVAAD